MRNEYEITYGDIHVPFLQSIRDVYLLEVEE